MNSEYGYTRSVQLRDDDFAYTARTACHDYDILVVKRASFHGCKGLVHTSQSSYEGSFCETASQRFFWRQ